MWRHPNCNIDIPGKVYVELENGEDSTIVGIMDGEKYDGAYVSV